MIFSAHRLSGLLSGIGLLSTFAFVKVAIAAEGLVPCRGTNCGTCELVLLTSNVIEFVILMLIASVSLVFGWAGFMMILAGGDSGKIAQAKKVFSSVFVGLIIALSGWLVVDTGLKILLVNNGQVKFSSSIMGPWNEIPAGACSSQTLLRDGALIGVGSSWDDVVPLYTLEPDSFDYWYSAFIKDATNNCLYEVTAGDETKEQCEERYATDISGHEQYTARFCDGTTGTPPPSLSALPLCSGGATAGQPGSGNCDVSNMGCFGSQAANASCICNIESGGNPNSVSGTDRCVDGNAYSFGLWQINLFAHYDKIPGCSAGFWSGGDVTTHECAEYRTNSNGLRYCARSNCRITDTALYNTCKSAVLNPTTNTQIACQLFDGDFSDWRNSANICGAPY